MKKGNVVKATETATVACEQERILWWRVLLLLLYLLLTSLCGVGSDTKHPLSRIQEVAGMVKGVEANNIGTRHWLRMNEDEEKGNIIELVCEVEVKLEAKEGKRVQGDRVELKKILWIFKFI